MTTLPYIETHVADHCNLNCRGCGHFSPLYRHGIADPATFDRDMTRLAGLLDNIDAIHLLGGEPLLNPRVLEFASSARRRFPRASARLVTNGVLLARQDGQFWEELARLDVRVDVTSYPVTLDREPLERASARHGTALRFTDVKDEFYTIPLDEKGLMAPEKAFNSCRSLFACPLLREGRIYPCPVAPLSPAFAERFDKELPLSEQDSLDIHGPVTGEEIAEFVARPIPWCRHCDTEHIRFFGWDRSRRAVEEWS